MDIDWGDGSGIQQIRLDASATGSQSFTQTHQYLDDNPSATGSDSYTITATVTDDDTGTGSMSTSVKISNVVPVVALNAVTAIVENGVATLTGTVIDPGSKDTFTVDINWGDGSETQTIMLDASVTGSQNFTLTHQYLDDNPTATSSDSYTITVRLTDDDTGTDSRYRHPLTLP